MACGPVSEEEPAPDAGPGAPRDGGSAPYDGGPPPDAGVVARAPCPVEGEDGCRALLVADLVPLVESRGLCMPAYAYPVDGSIDTHAFCLDTQRLIRARVAVGVVTAAEDVFGGVSGATGAVLDGTPTLFFVRSSTAGVSLQSWALEPPGATPSIVTLRGASVVPIWPQAAAIGEGTDVLLAFVRSQDRAFLARGRANELTVTDAPTAAPPLRGVLAHVGTTAHGLPVLTHQSADAGWRFTSFVQIETSAGFGDPIVVQPDQDNVHDTFPIARRDDGADLYYLRAPAGAPFLSAYRRFMDEDGTLGPEQLVTDFEVGHVEKPQPRRLPDGRIALMFARRITDARYDVALAILEGDAPRP